MQDKVTATVRFQGITQDEDAWDHFLYHVTLHYQGRGMETKFRTGLGWDREPNAADILESVLSDARGIYDQDFEAWAEDLGYDTDSRKAEAIYNACKEQTRQLCLLMGSEFYATVIEGIEDNEEAAERLTGISAVESNQEAR